MPGSPPEPVHRPTMRDVASLAGVSFKTVSRVVNDETGVSAALAARVRTAIEDLGFRPNAGAVTLRRSDHRSAAIGLLLPDVGNPYSAAGQRAVEAGALPRGVTVFTASHDDDPGRERALAAEFGARHVDGLIIAPAGDDQTHLAAEQRAGTPIVLLERDAGTLLADAVLSTSALGAAESVHHLAAAGHRRIAYLGDRASGTVVARHHGYRDALGGLGLPEDPRLVVHGLRDATCAARVVTALLARTDAPTALFTAASQVTIGAVRAVLGLGLGRAVALVGFDDFPLADLLSPAVTVVARDPAGMGRAGAEMTFDRIAGDDRPPAVRLVPTTLIRRGSGEIAPPR